MPINTFTKESLALITQRLKSLSRRSIKHPKSNHAIAPKRSAVLVPLCYDNNVPSILYTKRTSTLKNHSGEVSFPGGRIDTSESTTECALRETMEEIGINKEHIDVLGIYHDMQTQGRDNPVSVITPIIGYINTDLTKLQLNPSIHEVDFMFTVPLHKFLQFDDTIFHRKRYTYPAYNLTYQYIDTFKSRHSNELSKIRAPAQTLLQIWGASAIITNGFVTDILLNANERKALAEKDKENSDENEDHETLHDIAQSIKR